jgi:hypothetical protein
MESVNLRDNLAKGILEIPKGTFGITGSNKLSTNHSNMSLLDGNKKNDD